MFDIISIGDATLDTFITVDEAKVKCKIKQKECMLCFPYADKIPIETFEQKIAGNAANNAVGSARLGMNAAYWTIMGDDDTSDLLIKTLKEEGVSQKFVEIKKNSDSNFTVVLNYQGERTQLIHKVPRNYKLPNLDPSNWIYLSAMGENHDLSYNDLVKHIIKHNIKLAYNPGKIQIKCNKKTCIDLFTYTHVLFTNVEEAQLIVGTKTTTIDTLLDKLKKMGPHIVVITDGKNGSYACGEADHYYCPILEGPLVERTGAGDAYATAFIAALHYGKPIDEAMKWGTINAWSVIQHIGPQDGLMKYAAIKRKIKETPKLKVTTTTK